MTDPRRTPRRPRKPSPYRVVVGSFATFFALFGYMAYELRAGHDPALGNQVAAAAAPAKNRVVVKRNKHLPEDPATDAASPSKGAPATQQPSAPVVVPSAPAPAPAPTPAPVQTKTS